MPPTTFGRAADPKRDPRGAWFWWLGGPLPPLATLPHLYARRFGIEHGYKFDKQVLLRDAPCLRTAAQFARWTECPLGEARLQSPGSSHGRLTRTPDRSAPVGPVRLCYPR